MNGDRDNVEAGVQRLRNREPWLWINPRWQPAESALPGLTLQRTDVLATEARLERFAPLLAKLFPELKAAAGMIESELRPAPRLEAAWKARQGESALGSLWIKCDHALPVAGSIKARGGFHAVLHYAEELALNAGLLNGTGDDHHKLTEPRARELFSRHELVAGSTGNLGLSIGIMGTALGFRVTIHMSVEAKEWKKQRLRDRGVRVIEHAGDYTSAVAEARREAAEEPECHFIDDEQSIQLFLAYSVATLRLQRQLRAAGIAVDRQHPLFLYLPCGVGGAPGGISFGARAVFGDHVYCFFGEPVEAPCMLLGMLTRKHSGASVYDVGLRLKTDADGLAVSKPSNFVGQLMDPLVSGIYTLSDEQLYAALLAAYELESLELEPSACAGFDGPARVLNTPEGAAFLRARGLTPYMKHATHLLWTTGGALVPPEQHEQFRRAARQLTGPDKMLH